MWHCDNDNVIGTLVLWRLLKHFETLHNNENKWLNHFSNSLNIFIGSKKSVNAENKWKIQLLTIQCMKIGWKQTIKTAITTVCLRVEIVQRNFILITKQRNFFNYQILYGCSWFSQLQSKFSVYDDRKIACIVIRFAHLLKLISNVKIVITAIH